MPRKCANGTCKKVAILKRPKTESTVLPEWSKLRAPYAQYPKENLEKAIHAVREENMSCMKASKVFAVPRSTLKNYLQERSKLGIKPGRRRSIPEDIENNLVDQAIAAAEAGFPITKKEFLLKVELTAKKLNLSTQFKKGVPGNDYWRAVKTRRPDLASGIKKSDNQNINMKKSLESDIVSKYFDQLEKLLLELDLFVKPTSIWNAGEVGIQYCAEPVKLIPKRGTRDSAPKSVINSEMMNAVLCINAIGNSMPPLFEVTKDGVRTLQTFTVQSTPEASVWTMEESELKSDEVMLLWFREFFLENCGPDRPQLLIMDNHGSQEMLEMLTVAKENSIHILSLPPRTSPWLEPLDRGIFMMFQKCCRRVALQFLLDNPTLAIDYGTWPNVLCTVWEEVMRADVIMGAFEMTGTYPLDRSMIGQNALEAINSAHRQAAPVEPTVPKVSASAKKHKPNSVLGATSTPSATSSSQHNNMSGVRGGIETTPISTHYGSGSSTVNHSPLFQTHPHLNLSHHHSSATAANSVVSSKIRTSSGVTSSGVKPATNSNSRPNSQVVIASIVHTSPTPTVTNERRVGQAQTYNPVSSQNFIPSTDPASMFPVYST